MEYILKFNDETHNGGIKRIAIEQLEKASEHLRLGKDKHDAVHNTRKNLKKTRGLLKLIRGNISNKLYKNENKRLRNAGRQLAELRDASTHLEAVDQLFQNYTNLNDEDKNILNKIREQLELKKQDAAQINIEHDNLLENVAKEIDSIKENVYTWPELSYDFDAFEKGLKKTYKSGRQAMEDALEQPSEIFLHEWRKRSKDLWYQIRLMKEVWPSLMEALSSELDQLTNYMGEEHDMAVLYHQIIDNNIDFEKESERDRVLKIIEDYRLKLQEKIFPKGKRIFNEKASHFVKRIKNYWRISFETAEVI